MKGSHVVKYFTVQNFCSKDNTHSVFWKQNLFKKSNIFRSHKPNAKVSHGFVCLKLQKAAQDVVPSVGVCPQLEQEGHHLEVPAPRRAEQGRLAVAVDALNVNTWWGGRSGEWYDKNWQKMHNRE